MGLDGLGITLIAVEYLSMEIVIGKWENPTSLTVTH
jgi:hypothetical protein